MDWRILRGDMAYTRLPADRVIADQPRGGAGQIAADLTTHAYSSSAIASNRINIALHGSLCCAGSMEIMRGRQRAGNGEFGKAPRANRHYALDLLKHARSQQDLRAAQQQAMLLKQSRGNDQVR
jgi:hypothetical protein